MNVGKSTASPRDARGLTAAVVVGGAEHGAATYPMFGVRELTSRGAFLTGPFFLEVDETFVVRLSRADGTPVEVRARVVALRDGELPGMVVAFAELDDEHRAAVDDLAAAVD